VPARRHRGDAGRVEMFEMIGRQRADSGRERGAVLVGELLGMELDRQREARGGGEDALGLGGGEADALAERVDRIGQPRARPESSRRTPDR
jgi:hypothetical protein